VNSALFFSDPNTIQTYVMFLTPCCEWGGGGGVGERRGKDGKNISKCTRNIKNPLSKKSRNIQLCNLEIFSTDELKTKDTRKKNSLAQYEE